MNTCPECGIKYGPGTTVDVYKHIIGCLHLPDVGAARLLAEHEDRDELRSNRVVFALRASKQEA